MFFRKSQGFRFLQKGIALGLAGGILTALITARIGTINKPSNLELLIEIPFIILLAILAII